MTVIFTRIAWMKILSKFQQIKMLGRTQIKLDSIPFLLSGISISSKFHVKIVKFLISMRVWRMLMRLTFNHLITRS